jgi:hypothetical protein
MKSKMMMIVTCAGLVAAMLVSSCKKSNEVSKKDQTLDSLIGKATLTGVAYLTYDATQKAKIQLKEVAAGALITVSYNSGDLAYKTDANAITYTKSVSATTDANGKYSVTVDANVDGIVYTVQPTQFFGTYVDAKDTVSYKAYFNAASSSVSLKKGDSRYLDVKYNNTPQFIIPN